MQPALSTQTIQPVQAVENAPRAWARPRASVILDAAERLLLLALYAWLVARLVASMSEGGRLFNGLLLVSEGLVIVCLLLRRPTEAVSREPAHWLLAIASTCGPLVVSPSLGQPLVAPATAAFLWLCGTFLQVSAKIALGRSFGCVPAHRGLKRGGPYHFIRHPMYAGYLLSHVAFLLMNPTAWNLAIYAVCDGMQVPRIRFEEQLLGRDPAYREYCDEVPWRVIPGVFQRSCSEAVAHHGPPGCPPARASRPATKRVIGPLNTVMRAAVGFKPRRPVR